jgi:hypothetical protein
MKSHSSDNQSYFENIPQRCGPTSLERLPQRDAPRSSIVHCACASPPSAGIGATPTKCARRPLWLYPSTTPACREAFTRHRNLERLYSRSSPQTTNFDRVLFDHSAFEIDIRLRVAMSKPIATFRSGQTFICTAIRRRQSKRNAVPLCSFGVGFIPRISNWQSNGFV